MMHRLGILLRCLMAVQVLVLGAAAVNSELHEILHSHAVPEVSHAHAGEPCGAHDELPAGDTDAPHICAILFFATGILLCLVVLLSSRLSLLTHALRMPVTVCRPRLHLMCASLGARAPPASLVIA